MNLLLEYGLPLLQSAAVFAALGALFVSVSRTAAKARAHRELTELLADEVRRFELESRAHRKQNKVVKSARATSIQKAARPIDEKELEQLIRTSLSKMKDGDRKLAEEALRQPSAEGRRKYILDGISADRAEVS